MRCLKCLKKINIDSYECKYCFGSFCSVHRYSFEHECKDNNIKQEYTNKLIKNNPKIINCKFEKI